MYHPTFTELPEPKEIVIERLDNEIQVLTERLCLLKSQRNSLSVTYTLPVELLSEIFAIVQTKSKDSGNQPASKERFAVLRRWLPITHVSHYWRTVALDSSQLWFEIDELPAPAIETFFGALKRKKTVGGHHLRRALSTSVVYLSHGSPSQTLRANFSNPENDPPELRELNLTQGSVSLMDSIFQASTPKLDALSLSRCHFSPNCPLLKNDLTSLDAFKCPIRAITWLEILQQMPRLSYLVLSSSFTEETGGGNGAYSLIPKDFPIVQLLQLSELQVTGSLFNIDLDFLAHITFPSQTRFTFLSMCYDLQDGGESSLAALLRVHNGCRRNLSEIQVTEIKLEEDDVGPDAPAEAMYFSAYGRSGVCYLDVHLMDFHMVAFGASQMTAIASLPVSIATSFTTDWAIQHEAWEVLSSRFPKLQEISCSGPTVKSFLLSLGARETDLNPDSESTGEESNAATSRGLYKSLRSVEFYMAALYDWDQAIINVMRARCDDGMPVKNVTFNVCNFNSALLSRLEGLVDVVRYKHEMEGVGDD
ncbi:hypothetical protein BDN72DRAFT_961993 [Pluteus cervinus]|uniref:Uncharacterized protein n=1 Tax=Pluteus cervinus TaxID=181527 RepID=A0ACD3AK21_9AGAR|nr:hypothetical protein BDN72DRAFT_961993 [Pluteus cervinus]